MAFESRFVVVFACFYKSSFLVRFCKPQRKGKEVSWKTTTIATDAHKIHLPQTQQFEISEGYKYVNRNVLFVLFSFLFKYLIIYPIFYPITKIMLGFKARGLENLKELKGGAVSVSNHAHILDAPMVTFTLFPRDSPA